MRTFQQNKKPAPPTENWIWGEHSVRACFETSPEIFLEIFVERAAHGQHWKLFEQLKDLNASVVEKLPRFLSEKRTQGIAARIKKFPVLSIDKLYESDENVGQVLVLDRIQDPQNFGAILRSAAAMGAESIVVGTREQCPVNGTVSQVSAGNVFRLKIYTAHNLAKAALKLKELGFSVLALEAGGNSLQKWVPQSGKIAWLVGAEEDGIQKSLLETADEKIGIPMEPGVESLNVSNSVAIALYAAFTKLKK